MKSIVEEEELDNDMSFSQNVLPTSTVDNTLSINIKQQAKFTVEITHSNKIEDASTLCWNYQISKLELCCSWTETILD